MNTLNKLIVERMENLGYEVALKEVNKNGVILTGLQITDKDSNVHPVIYLDGIEGKLDEVVDKIVKTFEESRMQSIDVDHILTKSFIREHITIALQRKGDEELEKKPFMDDMEQYLVVMWERNAMKVRAELLKHVEMTSAEAWSYAHKNLNESTTIRSMNEVLAEMMGIDLEEMGMVLPDNPMSVITANNNVKGASGILNTEALKEYGAKNGISKFYFIPSSIHEGILLPADELDIKTASEMVKEVNSNEVDPVDQLSDRAYLIEV